MTKTQKIILIKIGGSLITDKNTPFSLNKRNLGIIANEISYLYQRAPFKLLLGHGSGSFGHTVAATYQTQNGVNSSNFEEVLGVALVKEAASRLNQIIIQKLLKLKVPATTIHPDSFLYSEDKHLIMAFWQNLNHLLKMPVLPVVYGDVIFDQKIGATIFSTEQVLAEIGKTLVAQGWQVTIVHCGATKGVYNTQGKTIPLITPSNFASIASSIGGSAGIDVTGGMIHKVKTSLELTKFGITSYITDGVTRGSLRKLLLEGIKTDTTVIEGNL